jgi:hypothetical protein
MFRNYCILTIKTNDSWQWRCIFERIGKNKNESQYINHIFGENGFTNICSG